MCQATIISSDHNGSSHVFQLGRPLPDCLSHALKIVFSGLTGNRGKGSKRRAGGGAERQGGGKGESAGGRGGGRDARIANSHGAPKKGVRRQGAGTSLRRARLADAPADMAVAYFSVTIGRC
jgi:hypothetical protein